ncbi:MAG: HEPN domain-containing protein [Armatimonadota bacterium]|nr:HEPN domain-containing protein [Armatimonadota bacterium]MDR7544999.1 HEPN domain-containing protein [Armatimonadota bacterium]
MAERSRDWVEQARRDLESARLQAEGGFFEWACFISQQAAEKAVKAAYQKLGGEAWGHALGPLLEGLREKVPVADELLACGRLLDRFYIPARYPNSWDRGSPKDYFTQEDAGHALRCAESILRFCEGLLAQQR